MWKVLIAILAVTVLLLGWNTLRSETYYRGVYETCVRQSITANRTTSFDLLACTQLERRARREQWFKHKVVVQ